jgi:hypothetical protein
VSSSAKADDPVTTNLGIFIRKSGVYWMPRFRGA